MDEQDQSKLTGLARQIGSLTALFAVNIMNTWELTETEADSLSNCMKSLAEAILLTGEMAALKAELNQQYRRLTSLMDDARTSLKG